ncbi:RDD family protein [Streptomyces blattellae]|uniref:RDD family protein n=1 Tax=Streptomyces blattellae TaxID=2569855 RepID=UPI0012B77FB9|nr:RDD family protein [Streptomyces blattellae]
MSAPTPAPGDDRPREGYYPDPSIPGYVRYWNGASWVPGTSRPAPADGEPLAPPPGADPAPAPAQVEETGPHFFDEDPDGSSGAPGPADAQYGSRPEPASAWGADRSRQSGFVGDQDRRVSWGAAQEADPRVPADAQAQPDGQATARTDGTATIPPTEPDGVDSGNTFVFRRPTPGPGAAAASASPGTDEAPDGTMKFRALSPRTPQQTRGAGARSGGSGSAGSAGAASASAPAGAASASAASAAPAASASAAPAAAPSSGSGPAAPGFGAGKAAAARAAAVQQPATPATPATPAVPAPTAPSGGPQQPALAVPQQPGAPQSGTPMTSGSGGGQPSWAQQVHQLAGGPGDDQPVVPWKPPVEDIFQAAAMRQASARPAGLGKRLAARLVDTVVLAAVTSVAAVPLGTQAMDHVNEKIDAAKLSGETVTVWLLDGTTSTYLGIVLAVLLLFGVAYEVLPTHRWGRTLGKKLLGLEVRDIEGHEPPSFGAAVRRWLVYSVPGLLVVGVVGVVWCLFDRPWHQCWHDKAARTFVAG